MEPCVESISLFAALSLSLSLCQYGGSRKVGTCPQEQIGPKPQVPTLISEAKVGTWSKPAKRKVGTCIAEREELQLLRPLQYCRERETTIATTAPVLQTARNCNHYDRSIIAKRGRKKL